MSPEYPESMFQTSLRRNYANYELLVEKKPDQVESRRWALQEFAGAACKYREDERQMIAQLIDKMLAEFGQGLQSKPEGASDHFGNVIAMERVRNQFDDLLGRTLQAHNKTEDQVSHWLPTFRERIDKLWTATVDLHISS